MFAQLKKFGALRRLRPPADQGEAGIEKLGHRLYVGGKWEEIGRLQFDYLVSQGLRSEHVLLDIACGSLRGGVHFIPYLDAGNYLGVEKEQGLVERGLRHELPAGLAEEKRPEFVVSSEFDFQRLSKARDFAIAQSLFTHLPGAYIRDCFVKLRAVAKPTTRFFATYLVSQRRRRNLRAGSTPHDHLGWSYSRQQIEEFGRTAGWDGVYHGEWGHPGGQVMAEYRPKIGP